MKRKYVQKKKLIDTPCGSNKRLLLKNMSHQNVKILVDGYEK